MTSSNRINKFTTRPGFRFSNIWLLIAVLLAFSSHAAEPSYHIVPDEYIITFKPGLDRVQTLGMIAETLSQSGVRLRHTFHDVFNGYSARIPPAVLARLQQHPAIESIEPNGIWYLYTVDAPSNLVAISPTSTQVDLTWTDNATTEQGTEVVRSVTGIGGDYLSLEILFGENITSYTDTTVSANQEYCYMVRVGENFNVVGGFSQPDCVTPQSGTPNPPAPPSNLTLTVINDGRIDINWIDGSANESGFRIERALGIGGVFVEIDLVGANVETYSDTGLVAETEYCYRVRAFNGDGDSIYTNEVCGMTAPPSIDPLAAPTNVTAGQEGESAIRLNWTDNATSEQGTEIQRSLTGAGGVYSSIDVLIGVNIDTYLDVTATVGVEHCYRIRVGETNTNLGPFSIPVCATIEIQPPVIPNAPSTLALTVVSSQQINLGWQDNSDDESGFRISRGATITGPFTELDLAGADISTYTDGALNPETQYCYIVTAFNPAGESAPTLAQCATTSAGPVGCIDPGVHDSLVDLWGIDKVDAELNATWQSASVSGCEITTRYFNIDSGVDSDHPDLNVVETMGFIASDPANTGEDDNGHGTHTAGTTAAIDGNGGVVGVAPGAPVYGFKVCGASGSCVLDDIVAGVDEVTARKLADPQQPMVANMSLGGGVSSVTDTAVRRSINVGVVYSISAGNGLLGACLFPADAQNSSPARVGDDLINSANGSDGDLARINGAITVTSSNQSDGDNNCNFGDPVTVAAPGNAINSTWLNGGYNTISGTSMAAPHVAGAAILYLERFPQATPTEVEQAIVNGLDPWFPDDIPSAEGRLNVKDL